MNKLAIALFALILTSCNSNPEPEKLQDESQKHGIFEARIATLEKQLYADTLGSLNKEQAAIAMSTYTEFVGQFPNDKKSPEYLFKAAQLAVALKKYEHAIEHYNAIEKDYKDHEKAPVSLFLKAFAYDNYLNDDAKAKETYELFIQKYPSHELVKDAQFSLQNIGKSDAELIKEFEARLKK
jgi:TolA-binding protein